ncbi:hypothetical protein [Porphyrobacter sp. ULC335]|jgi:hypothetical protein|uniref:hypothetical protein n=1 Tax=Porphyrobacter sp. ULC335 TaxID=2854260 RepID=UPI002220859C|nr:hypothetical protein [Porphyrobacter sp. ULC335]UYV15303.1 hypothetical protein KVF90_14440 [Porphyrobacter sp. ULC335]
MRITALAFAASATLALAACGSESSGSFTTSDGKDAEYRIDAETGETSMTIDGENGTTSLRSGEGVPLSLPEGFSLFPGSKVLTNTVVTEAGGGGAMVTYETDAAADTVIAHYRDQAKAAGFDIAAELTTNGTITVIGERKSDGSGLSVTATKGDGVTTGQITIGIK